MKLTDKWAGALMTAKAAWDNAFLVEDRQDNSQQQQSVSLQDVVIPKRRYIVPITTAAIVEIAKAIMKGDDNG